jgi:hypothetical protein
VFFAIVVKAFSSTARTFLVMVQWVWMPALVTEKPPVLLSRKRNATGAIAIHAWNAIAGMGQWIDCRKPTLETVRM